MKNKKTTAGKPQRKNGNERTRTKETLSEFNKTYTKALGKAKVTE